MIDDKVFLHFPVNFKDICKIYPPTVNDVVGNDKFIQYQSLFTLSQEELTDEYAKNTTSGAFPTPFQYLLISYYGSPEFKKLILDGFMYFLREPVTVVPELEVVIIGKSEEELDPDVDLVKPRLIDKTNYFDFQNQIRQIMGQKAIEPPVIDEDPRVARIKAKFRQREKTLAKRQSGPKLGTLLAAICCMGIGLNPLNIGEMSYACVPWLIQMYQQQEEYDVDIRALLAGADKKKVKPKYWIRNLNLDK